MNHRTRGRVFRMLYRKTRKVLPPTVINPEKRTIEWRHEEIIYLRRYRQGSREHRARLRRWGFNPDGTVNPKHMRRCQARLARQQREEQ